MTSPEIDTQAIADGAPIRNWRLKMAALGILAFLLAAAIACGAGPDDDDDRPPIYVRNGSVEIEEVFTGLAGTLTKSPTALVWQHRHQHPGPRHLNVSVSGISAGSCSTTGRFFRSRVTNLSIQYRIPDGSTRQIALTIQQNGPNRYLELTADPGATVAQPSQTQLTFEGAGTQLTQVTLNGPGVQQAVCAFDPAATAGILVMQPH